MGNVEETLVGSMLVMLTENKTGLQTVSRTCGNNFFSQVKEENERAIFKDFICETGDRTHCKTCEPN